MKKLIKKVPKMKFNARQESQQKLGQNQEKRQKNKLVS